MANFGNRFLSGALAVASLGFSGAAEAQHKPASGGKHALPHALSYYKQEFLGEKKVAKSLHIGGLPVLPARATEDQTRGALTQLMNAFGRSKKPGACAPHMEVERLVDEMTLHVEQPPVEADGCSIHLK